jgi:hypothetical protein
MKLLDNDLQKNILKFKWVETMVFLIFFLESTHIAHGNTRRYIDRLEINGNLNR